MLGNKVLTVKRWENPEYVDPPADAWRVLLDLLYAHRRAVDTVLDIVERQLDSNGGEPSGPVRLLYYRTQTEYDEYGRDSGDYGLVNARSREVALRLGLLGIDTVFEYPEETDELEFKAEDIYLPDIMMNNYISGM